MIIDLNRRTREILRHIVEAYVETGEPIGSRTISRRFGLQLSPATVRNVMADLEEMGLLRAPHTSAGRLPTEAGLRLFVNGLLEVGQLAEDERDVINARCSARGQSLAEVLERASLILAGLSSCAGLVVAPRIDRALRHIEFVHLGPGRALVVLVTDDGMVENRVIEIPGGVLPVQLQQATNYLNMRLIGRTLDEARADILVDIEEQRSELDVLSGQVVAAGLAVPVSDPSESALLIVRGQSNLLEDVTALSDLERIRLLFETLETKEAMLRLMDATRMADGVQIFIGAENALFRLAGCSMIVAPYQNSQEQIVGAIGVIGPTRMNYARIIPMVDYTAKVVSRLLG